MSFLLGFLSLYDVSSSIKSDISLHWLLNLVLKSFIDYIFSHCQFSIDVRFGIKISINLCTSIDLDVESTIGYPYALMSICQHNVTNSDTTTCGVSFEHSCSIPYLLQFSSLLSAFYYSFSLKSFFGIVFTGKPF